ncbi:rhodanese-like domain-containing protein [Legionella oakridgensis]|uniref:Rhodanese-related sulfurtransferase n=2 Tax=Legionella oakridgensis TaxID=29423 RepID=W0BHB8_9GAMM|nr:rhodanese-like domain-containing protein [Legionella oakridgensis]AHE67794.1 rhodanese-related sulfurtransferase [Legionella oakridgensis ATCC 33761 = DSM 21215]ETO92653.1 rhodanese-related sulfurtransferase [Legionella oakridgensis RV-2-2007]KTD44041.1 Rhodanese domain protein [Legionella oakridgensis]STY20809.1 Rhodanese domain protein [Legionella longbeachae]
MSDNKVTTINVHELKRRLDADPQLCLIDVREKHEWQSMHIASARHIPKDELVARIEHEIPERECPIYLHCRGGVRSLYAAECLINMGYQQVYSVDGGIMEWDLCGYPVEK